MESELLSSMCKDVERATASGTRRAGSSAVLPGGQGSVAKGLVLWPFVPRFWSPPASFKAWVVSVGSAEWSSGRFWLTTLASADGKMDYAVWALASPGGWSPTCCKPALG